MGDHIKKFKNIYLKIIPPAFMRELAIRRIKAYDLSFPEVEFKIASSEEEMAGAFKLLKESYTRRGIVKEGQMRLQIINLLPSSTTFIAKKGDRILGTISLIEDSELGLPMEKVHEKEVGSARGLFRHLAEVGALAVLPDQQGTGLSIMLYNMMYRWARNWRRIDDLLIAVHPSAQYFYRNLLLFRSIGPVQRYVDLHNADSLPMHLDIPGVQMQFHRIYKGRVINEKQGLDFYKFFCAPSDRFDFSAHPEFSKKSQITGSLPENVMSRLLDQFGPFHNSIREIEVAALRNYFPSSRLLHSVLQ